jgi:hypothetical protein
LCFCNIWITVLRIHLCYPILSLCYIPSPSFVLSLSSLCCLFSCHSYISFSFSFPISCTLYLMQSSSLQSHLLSFLCKSFSFLLICRHCYSSRSLSYPLLFFSLIAYLFLLSQSFSFLHNLFSLLSQTFSFQPISGWVTSGVFVVFSMSILLFFLLFLIHLSSLLS